MKLNTARHGSFTPLVPVFRDRQLMDYPIHKIHEKGIKGKAAVVVGSLDPLAHSLFLHFRLQNKTTLSK